MDIVIKLTSKNTIQKFIAILVAWYEEYTKVIQYVKYLQYGNIFLNAIDTYR